MGRNIGKTQEEGKLTWSVRATEGTGTCGGKTRQNKQKQGSVRRRQRKENNIGSTEKGAECLLCPLHCSAAFCICNISLKIHCILAQIK